VSRPLFLPLVILSAFLAPLPAEAQAQSLDAKLADVAKQLAGTQSYDWVFERLEVVMGSSHKCKSGESWRFFGDQRVEIQVCEKGNLVTTKSEWSLSPSNLSSLDTVISIGKDRYYLTFRNEAPSRHYMRLRSIVTTIAEPRTDKEFLRQDHE
jgi:hypothetical protein